MAGLRRKPGIKGRTDLGVGRDETGAYEVEGKTVYRLRHLLDGQTRDFVDDGSGSNGVPMQGRQTLTHALKKAVPIYRDGEEVEFPLFFYDKRNKYQRAAGLIVPVADKETRDVMEAAVLERRHRSDRNQRDWDNQKLVAEAERIRTEDAARKAVGKSDG